MRHAPPRDYEYLTRNDTDPDVINTFAIVCPRRFSHRFPAASILRLIRQYCATTRLMIRIPLISRVEPRVPRPVMWNRIVDGRYDLGDTIARLR